VTAEAEGAGGEAAGEGAAARVLAPGSTALVFADAVEPEIVVAGPAGFAGEGPATAVAVGFIGNADHVLGATGALFDVWADARIATNAETMMRALTAVTAQPRKERRIEVSVSNGDAARWHPYETGVIHDVAARLREWPCIR
jgi:hypothetical protein